MLLINRTKELIVKSLLRMLLSMVLGCLAPRVCPIQVVGRGATHSLAIGGARAVAAGLVVVEWYVAALEFLEVVFRRF